MVLTISARAKAQPETGKQMEEGRWASACSIGARSGGIEVKCEQFEAVHREQTRNHRVGRDVPRIRNLIEVKLDKLCGVQKQLS